MNEERFLWQLKHSYAINDLHPEFNRLSKIKQRLLKFYDFLSLLNSLSLLVLNYLICTG